jgi:hypothetical protein
MDLKDCKHGLLVQKSNSHSIGMIVGITNSNPSEDFSARCDPMRAIPLVQWAEGGTYGVHPANIELFK